MTRLIACGMAAPAYVHEGVYAKVRPCCGWAAGLLMADHMFNSDCTSVCILFHVRLVVFSHLFEVCPRSQHVALCDEGWRSFPTRCRPTART